MRIAACLTALGLASPALGQGFTHPPGVSPTITPAMLPAAIPGLRVPGPFGVRPLFNPVPQPYFGFNPYGTLPAFGYQPLYGFGGTSNFIGPSYGYGFGYGGSGFGNFPVPVGPAAPPLAGTSPVVSSGPGPDSPLTAQLAIEFPAEVELRIDGKTDAGKGVKTDAGVTRTVTTRALKPGETATLKIAAEWDQDGARVEWDRAVTLTRGETARLKVERGFPKKAPPVK